jgi:methionyl aminopeptidase
MRLRDGMTIAIEPWFMAGGRDAYLIDDDGWTLRSDDGSRGAHFEHTIAITDDQPRVLTKVA